MDSNFNNFTDMCAQIVSVLQGVTVNGSAVFADVQPYPTLNFAGSPAATVAPSDNSSDYATTVQNLRTYTWFVDIYVPVEETNTGYATAFSQAMTLMDSTLYAFDNSNSLNGTCQILEPAPSAWLIVESSFGVTLQARINIKARLTVTTNNG